MRALNQHLRVLEGANLIRQVGSSPKVDYAFRHSMMQDTAYASLLKSDRAVLHGAVGAVLEAEYPEQQTELAHLLAHHFAEAGDLSKAQRYFALAAEHAKRLYAHLEAIENYTRALAIAESRGDMASISELRRGRGQLYEIVGHFDDARSDHEAALEAAQSLGDSQGAWQALVDLGDLWAGKDYERTGAYYGEALTLARRLGDEAILAHTLNRMGNLDTNVASPLAGAERHRQALAIFEELGDEVGIAQTMDFLATATLLAGDMAAGSEYGLEASRLFLKQGNDLRLAGTMAMTSMVGVNLQNDHVVPFPTPVTDLVRDAIQARRLSAEIGWRSNEAFAMFVVAVDIGAVGEYGEAIRSADEAIEIADQIGHDQWRAAANGARGLIMLELLLPARAAPYLEEGLAVASRSNSSHWQQTIASYIARAHSMRADFEAADRLLTTYDVRSLHPNSISERALLLALAEVELARGEPDVSLHALQTLFETAPGWSPGVSIPKLDWLKARALIEAGQTQGVEDLLLRSIEEAKQRSYRTILWRLYSALARLHDKMGRDKEAAKAANRASAVVDALSKTIPDHALRSQYVARALRWVAG